MHCWGGAGKEVGILLRRLPNIEENTLLSGYVILLYLVNPWKTLFGAHCLGLLFSPLTLCV